MIELGQLAKDKVTGLEGILVGRCQYLTRGDQYGIARSIKDGEIIRWFDERRIVITGEGATAGEVASEYTTALS